VCSAKIDDRMSRIVTSISSTASWIRDRWIARGAGERALQRETDCKESLNHSVVEVARNPFAVVDQGELFACALELLVGGTALRDIAYDRDHKQLVAHAKWAQTYLERKLGARPRHPAEGDSRPHRPGPRVRGVLRPPPGVQAASLFGQQQVDRHAHELVTWIFEELFDHRVDEDDRSGRVDDRDPVRSRIESLM
jgi:hypothetical protein